MKKKLSVILLTVALFAVCVLMTACSGKPSDKQYFDKYGFENPPEYKKTYDVDEGVTLDGKLSEDFWRDGRAWLTAQSSDGSGSNNNIVAGTLLPCEVRVTSYFTDKGMYFGAEVDDNIVNVLRTTGTPLRDYQKTALTIYLAPAGTTSLGANTYELIFNADGKALLRRYYLGTYNNYPMTEIGYAVSVNGQLDRNGNGAEIEGYTIEAFVPWSEVGLTRQEYISCAFATIRHQNETDRSQFGWEILNGANYNRPYTWTTFCEKGLFVADEAEDYVIDGDDGDWSEYEGEVKRVELNDATRYVKYKMTRGNDGLYVYAEALQRLWLTGNSDWYRNTNIEIQITNESGGSSQYYLTSEQAVKPNTYGVMKCKDNAVGKYKLITAEMFIPYTTLHLANVDVDGETMRVGLAFRNGTYQNDGDGKTLETNEVIVRSCPGVDTAKPFIFFAVGCNPYSASYRLYVSDKGIRTNIEAKDKVIDGKFDDWADYHGVDAAAYGRGHGNDISSIHKGFNAKVQLGSDGAYVYATVKHAAWKTWDQAQHMNSNLAVGFALTNTDYTGNNSTLEWLRGREIFFTSVGSNFGPNVAQYIERSAERDENGLYTTVIEGFIPYNQMFSGLLTTKDSYYTDSRVDWTKVFNPATGEVADGYALRVGVQWRTGGEIAYMQGRGASDAWIPCIFESVPQKSCAWKMYFVDENGLHMTAHTPTEKHIDGKSDDWNDYGGEVTRVTANPADERYVESKAYLGADGLYTITEAKMNSFASCVADNGNHWEDSKRFSNTVLELRYINASGANSRLAYVNPFNGTNASDIYNIDYCFNVEYKDGYYNIVIETFISNAHLNLVGASRDDLKIGFSYGNNYSGNFAAFAESDWVDFRSSGQRLWFEGGWNNKLVTDGGMCYFVTENGLKKTLEA